jgi:RNA polymerase sigma-70 factor (ECF subfamily)
LNLIAEATLVNELKNKATQAKAFEVLVDTYGQRLYWHIRRIVIDHDDSDDVLQNTFIKIYRNIESFKGQSKLYSWMYRIATNEALQFIKVKSRKLVRRERLERRVRSQCVAGYRKLHRVSGIA